MISTLMVLVACILDGKTEAPTYGQVIEAMAQAAWELKEPRLSALVSDLSLQCLERGQWAESEGAGTVRVLSRKLRNRGRASLRTRHQATSRKRAQRARQRLASGGAKDSTPVPREVLYGQPEAACERFERTLAARDELRGVGFESLSPRAQACLVATDVVGLRYRAAADLLGMESEDQVRKTRCRALRQLRT